MKSMVLAREIFDYSALIILFLLFIHLLFKVRFNIDWSGVITLVIYLLTLLIRALQNT